MLTDGDQVPVPEAMLANSSAVDEAAVRAAQVDQEPAFAGLHEQVLKTAHVTAVEADIAAIVAPENDARAAELDFSHDGLAARHDQTRRLDVELARIREVHGRRRQSLLDRLLPGRGVVTQIQADADLFQ